MIISRKVTLLWLFHLYYEYIHSELRVLPLKVSGPFHSWLLEEAGSELYKVLEPVELKALSVPYVTNVDAVKMPL